jgi:hypothetical protein
VDLYSFKIIFSSSLYFKYFVTKGTSQHCVLGNVAVLKGVRIYLVRD